LKTSFSQNLIFIYIGYILDLANFMLIMFYPEKDNPVNPIFNFQDILVWISSKEA